MPNDLILDTPMRRGGAVQLKGGPMNGWIVKADAPALQPEWYDSSPKWMRNKWAPGRYVRKGRETFATWRKKTVRKPKEDAAS